MPAQHLTCSNIGALSFQVRSPKQDRSRISFLQAKLSTQAPPATQANAQSKFKFNPNASEFVPLAKKSPVASVHQSPQSSRSGTPKAGTGNRRTQFNNRSQGNRQTRNATKLGRTMEGWPSGSRPHYPLPPSQPQGILIYQDPKLVPNCQLDTHRSLETLSQTCCESKTKSLGAEPLCLWES